MVEINVERKAVEIKWDASLSDSASVVIRATGEAGDVHNTASLPNDGLAPVSYPSSFSGSSFIEILDEAGEVFDSGDIAV
jgi:hypothetical protein